MPPPPDSARQHARIDGLSRRRGWLRAALHAPLFWKLLLPQLVLVGVLLGVVVAAIPRITSVGGLALVLGTSVAVTVALSAWVVHLALHPVRGLVDARRTQRDDARRVLVAEARERERIAHDLYAGTAQTLAGVLIRLRILQRAFDGGESVPILEEVVSEVRLALEGVRGVARRLRPPELDELGVRAALEAHARRLVDAFGIPVTFDGDVPEAELDPGARLALFRIVQEGLTNAAQHAGAARIEVRFRELATTFRAEVVDDGTGFDPGSAAPSADARLGLVGMRERAEYVQGRFSIDSTPGGGTVLRLDLPWTLTPALHRPPAPSTLEFDLAPHP